MVLAAERAWSPAGLGTPEGPAHDPA